MKQPQDLAVRCEGQGLPILFAHGWTMAGFAEVNDFEPIFNKKTGYRRMYVDLPGMGDTPAGGIKDLDSMLECVSSFVERYILPSNFLLVGTSCGAYLARTLACKYASSLEGFLLRVPLVEPVSLERDVDPFVPAISDEGFLSSLSAADREKLGDISVQTPEYIDTSRRMETLVLPTIAACDSAALDPIRNAPDRYTLTSTMHTLEDPFLKPTLILTGRQDTDVGYRDAWPLVDSYPRATFVALDRADHGYPVDDIDLRLFETLVDDWLRSAEELRRMGI